MLRHLRLTDPNVDDGQEEVDGYTRLHRVGDSSSIAVRLQWRIVVTGKARRTAGQIRSRTTCAEGGHELPVLPQRRE